MRLKLQRGFTLIEMMIVVAIIGILAAVAYFNYAKYGMRSRRSDAKQLLAGVAAAEERWYTNNNTYITTLGTGGLAFKTPTTSFYTISVVAGGLDASCASTVGTINSNFTVVATPISTGGQRNDACGALSLDNAQNHCPLASNAAANSNGSCW